MTQVRSLRTRDRTMTKCGLGAVVASALLDSSGCSNVASNLDAIAHADTQASAEQVTLRNGASRKPLEEPPESIAAGTYTATLSLTQDDGCSQSWAFSQREITVRLDVLPDGTSSFQLFELSQSTSGSWSDPGDTSYHRNATSCRWDQLRDATRPTEPTAVRTRSSWTPSLDGEVLQLSAELTNVDGSAPYGCWADGPARQRDGKDAVAGSRDWVLSMECQEVELRLPVADPTFLSTTAATTQGAPNPKQGVVAPALLCSFAGAAPTMLSEVLRDDGSPVGPRSIILARADSYLLPSAETHGSYDPPAWKWQQRDTAAPQ